ncbi:MAG: hypothetical protein HY430_00270 [Candidatus Levybacteria bacterium]|nr:hypothetical protein [Candidatus Levybacteria bacterium]
MQERRSTPREVLAAIPNERFVPRAARKVLKAQAGERPRQVEKLVEILGDIGRQVLDVKPYESNAFKNVTLLVSEVDVDALVARHFGADYPDGTTDPTRRITHVIHQGFSPPGFGHSGTALPMVQERVMSLMPPEIYQLQKGQPAPEARVIVTTLPTATGNRVTTEFVEALEKEGLMPLAREFASVTVDYTKDAPENHEVVFEGVSQGTVTADGAYRSLPDDRKKNIRLLLYAPVANHAESEDREADERQLILGYFSEMGESIADGSFLRAVAEHLDLNRELLKVLKANDLNPHMSLQDLGLKYRAMIAIIAALKKGVTFSKDAPAHLVRPRRDRLIRYSKEVEDWAEKKLEEGSRLLMRRSGKATEVFVEGRHMSDGIRPIRWVGIVDFAQNR